MNVQTGANLDFELAVVLSNIIYQQPKVKMRQMRGWKLNYCHHRIHEYTNRQ
jgi:hypothetical protein